MLSKLIYDVHSRNYEVIFTNVTMAKRLKFNDVALNLHVMLCNIFLNDRF